MEGLIVLLQRQSDCNTYYLLREAFTFNNIGSRMLNVFDEAKESTLEQEL